MEKELNPDEVKKLIHYSSYEKKEDQYNELKKKFGVYLPSKHCSVM